LNAYLLIFLGGGLGAAARHGVNRAALVLVGPDYPAGTLFVNVAGCLIMGLLAGWFAFRGETSSAPLRLFLTTGVLGGFTTFSAFALDAAVLWERHDQAPALTYIGVSVIASIVAVFAGLATTRALLS
jgi:CrcB protein